VGTIEKDRILQLRGEDLYGSGVERIGTVEEIYLDVGGEDVEIDGIGGRSDRA